MALLKRKGRGWAWAPEGYRDGRWMDQGQRVEVLTPRTVVDVIGAGYVPRMHGWEEGGRRSYRLLPAENLFIHPRYHTSRVLGA